ncbi:MAG: ferritin-like domain-containing protein [Acidobacteriota bacterium]|nr:ferritin-like domain-containing protein [Acidobacteriota bacterium]
MKNEKVKLGGSEKTDTPEQINPPKNRPTSRRSFFRGAAIGGVGVGLGALVGPRQAVAAGVPGITPGDLDILRFLAAAETLETDLWDQYWELAAGNEAYGRALNNIEDELVTYTCDVAANERSHEQLINAFLVANGQAPVLLDDFRTLPSSNATGAQHLGRLTNLMELTVDTSWYLRYRDPGNPDFGDTYPQFIEIKDRAVIPPTDHISELSMQIIANAAAFHFANSEELGASIYPALAQKVTNIEVLKILLSIGPTEAYFFAAFHQSLEGLPAISGDGLTFPDVKIDHLGGHHIPRNSKFLQPGLPQVCVIRPISTAKAGAVNQIVSGTKANLYKGQSQQFFDFLMGLATKADAAVRGV